VIIRPTGPYLHLVVSPCDDEGSFKCSNWDSSSDCLSDDNRSISEDLIAMEFFRSCESSHQNNMVFLSPRTSFMLDESHRTVSEYHERKSDVGDVFGSQYYSPNSQSLERSLDFEFDSWNDSCELDISSKSDGAILQDHMHSREFKREFNSGDLDNDLYVSRLNNLSKTQSSHKTTKAKRHVLELGAGLLRKDDRSIQSRFNRMRPNRSAESKIDFFHDFDALAYV